MSPTERPCASCSKLFTPKPYRGAKGNTCSSKCAGRLGGRKRIENMRASGATAQTETVSNVGTEQPDK